MANRYEADANHPVVIGVHPRGQYQACEVGRGRFAAGRDEGQRRGPFGPDEACGYGHRALVGDRDREWSWTARADGVG